MQSIAIKLVIQPQAGITPELEDRQILLEQPQISLDPTMKSWTTETLRPAGAVLMGRSSIADMLPD